MVNTWKELYDKYGVKQKDKRNSKIFILAAVAIFGALFFVFFLQNNKTGTFYTTNENPETGSVDKNHGIEGAASLKPRCSSDIDCDDNNSSTADSCINPRLSSSYCLNSLETCQEQGKTVCSSDESCAGSWTSSSDSARCCSASCTKLQCSDGTPYGQCSATKPNYCDSGNLINKCSVCGCNTFQNCQLDEKCSENQFDFSISSPSGGIVTKGKNISATIVAALISGTAQPVSLSCFGLPFGTSCSFSAVSLMPAAASTMTISTLSTASAGSYSITISGTGRGLTRTKTYNLTIIPEADTISPAAISNLAVSNPTSSSATLIWTATGDDGSIGTATQYDIRYSTSPITDANWISATQVTGESAPKTTYSSESFTITGLTPDTTYYFGIKTADEVPNWSGLSNVASGTTSIPEVRISAYIKSGISGIDEASYRAFIENINQLYSNNGIKVKFKPERIEWYSGESCGSDFYGNDVIMCVGPDKGGYIGPPYYVVGANTNSPFGFSSTGIRAEAHELAHFLGFQDLYWLKTQSPLIAPSIASNDLMMDPYTETNVFGELVKSVIKMNLKLLDIDGKESIKYPKDRVASKLSITIDGLPNRECKIYTRERDYTQFNSKIKVTESLVKTTDSSANFEMDVIGGDSVDNNFDLYYISCGSNNFWLSSLETEKCFQNNGPNHICNIRCSNTNGWCAA